MNLAVDPSNLAVDPLRDLFTESFRRFLSTETDNIRNGVSERNLCSRLAICMQETGNEAGLLGYFADVEYNRKQEGKIKTILDDQMKVIPITCDLIYHSRGESVISDNLIAVEMKRYEHPHQEKQSDRARLRAMTKESFDDIWSADGVAHPEHVCGYVLGYFIELNIRSNHFLIEEYQRGEFLRNITINF